MYKNEYAMKEIASDGDNLNNGLYFSNCKGPVYVERSMLGTYEYDSVFDQESSSDTLDNDTRELKKSYCNKSKKILILGSIVLVLILCSVLLGIKHALSDNSLGKVQYFKKS